MPLGAAVLAGGVQLEEGLLLQLDGPLLLLLLWLRAGRLQLLATGRGRRGQAGARLPGLVLGRLQPGLQDGPQGDHVVVRQGERLEATNGRLRQGAHPGQLECGQRLSNISLGDAELDPALLEAFGEVLQLAGGQRAGGGRAPERRTSVGGGRRGQAGRGDGRGLVALAGRRLAGALVAAGGRLRVRGAPLGGARSAAGLRPRGPRPRALRGGRARGTLLLLRLRLRLCLVLLLERAAELRVRVAAKRRLAQTAGQVLVLLGELRVGAVRECARLVLGREGARLIVELLLVGVRLGRQEARGHHWRGAGRRRRLLLVARGHADPAGRRHRAGRQLSRRSRRLAEQWLARELLLLLLALQNQRLARSSGPIARLVLAHQELLLVLVLRPRGHLLTHWAGSQRAGRQRVRLVLVLVHGRQPLLRAHVAELLRLVAEAPIGPLWRLGGLLAKGVAVEGAHLRLRQGRELGLAGPVRLRLALAHVAHLLPIARRCCPRAQLVRVSQPVHRAWTRAARWLIRRRHAPSRDRRSRRGVVGDILVRLVLVLMLVLMLVLVLVLVMLVLMLMVLVVLVVVVVGGGGGGCGGRGLVVRVGGGRRVDGGGGLRLGERRVCGPAIVLLHGRARRAQTGQRVGAVWGAVVVHSQLV